VRTAQFRNVRTAQFRSVRTINSGV
jgi:hypothetical protein